MIVVKPQLIVQRADDNKIQSISKHLARFPVEAQEGQVQADQTLAGYTQNTTKLLEPTDSIADGMGSSYLYLAGLVLKLKKQPSFSDGSAHELFELTA